MDADVSIIKPVTNVVKDYSFGSYSLPLSTDIKDWGVVVDKIKDTIVVENMIYLIFLYVDNIRLYKIIIITHLTFS
jgi:hypothetical protein